jgi:NitT/TauT family transport system ATP-binding protein
MFSTNAVSKRFGAGTLALDDITMQVETGDFIALLGPSGCGKSTLLRLLAGLEAPSSGQISWDAGHAPGAGEVGFVFQDATLLPWANAADNVFLPLRLRGKKRAEAETDVAAALAQVGLSEFASARPKALSGGMKMRVSIARAMVSQPILLLMDEPFAALDEFTRHKLQEDLRSLWLQTSRTIIFVTHSIYEAAYLANRILVMSPRPGRIAADIISHVTESPKERRGSPDYVALVQKITETFRRVMPNE